MKGASVGVGFLAAAGGVQLLYVTRPLWFLNQNVLTVDDAYYFLQVARNIARLGWATFDGLHATSGVQFLWAALLSVLAMVFDERMALIRAMLVLSVLLNIATGLTLRRFGTLLHSSEVGETVAVLWGMVMLRNTRTALIGWIDSNLPADAPIAAWNAGQLGYFLNRPVVNLDGIVNDREFLEFLRLREPISNYLNRQGVRYLVDYNDPDLSMPYRAA